MKKIIYLVFIIAFIFTGCSHRIVRTGYNTKKSDYKNCDVIIKRDFANIDSIAIKIGEIKLGDSGFSVACSEEHAINILKNEACAIEADLIYLTDEKRPDFWSSCYRCTASFYKLDSLALNQAIENDPLYKENEIDRRVKKDRGHNTALIIGGFFVGVLLGLLML